MKINFILIEKQTLQYPSVLIASESCISHAKSHLGEFLSGLDRKKTFKSRKYTHTNNNVSFPTIPNGV